MTTPQQPANAASLRGLGWDIDSPFSSNRGELLPVGSYGHTGFTGTSLWIDPVTNTYIIVLTNAVHPHGQDRLSPLRSRVATAVSQALNLTVSEERDAAPCPHHRLQRVDDGRAAHTSRNGEVKVGIDVLEEHDFRELHPDTRTPCSPSDS